VAVEAVNCMKDFIQGKQLIGAGRKIDPARAANAELPLASAVIEDALAAVAE